MNRKHVSKVGKYIGMACLLFVCGIVQSCRDEYFYDDQEPDFIGASIYDYLAGHEEEKFTLLLQVIEDLGYKNVLKTTGSKTLFVANDAAFLKGIKEEWGFDSYEQLTSAHKRVILYGAMLDNAYLLEMLSKMPSSGSNSEPTPGQCLRRVTSAAVTDTIGLFYYKDLPQANPDWDVFRDKGVRLALDATRPMLSHFIKEQLDMKNITERDLQIVVGNPAASISDIYIFDKKVLSDKDRNGNNRSDVVCKNGYVHQLEGLLIPPSNMAEELRQNGDLGALDKLSVSAVINNEAFDTTTLLFSRILDRFAVPVPLDENNDIVKTFNRLYNEGRDPEPIFVKQYYAESGSSGKLDSYVDLNDVRHEAVGKLRFDPGWNAYSEGSGNKELNMAAILAPSDRALVSYFSEGSGKGLVERYGKEVSNKNQMGGLIQAIDSIPLNVINALVNNHMQVSFTGTVPSKFAYIMDDARDDMNVNEKNLIKTLMANNGVVYVMDTLYSPARYISVISPIMLEDSLRIFNKFIEDEGYASYLLSMDNDFTVVTTSDSKMIYYSPYSEVEKKTTRNADKFKVSVADDGTLSFSTLACTYTPETYDSLTNTYADLKEGKAAEGIASALMKEVLEYNILLGDVNSETDSKSGRKYYMSKGYGTVMVNRDAEGQVVGIAGGRERQNGTMIPVSKSHKQENGYTLQLETSMIQPPTQSVYEVLENRSDAGEEFSEFFALLLPDESVLAMLLGPKKEGDEWNEYMVFENKKVRMFDTYHYSVYVPTNEAMEDAYAKGLPTWADLKAECDSINKLPNGALKDSLKANLKAGADLIISFARYHFQDNSVYVDNPPHALATDMGGGNFEYDYDVNYETSSLNDVTNRFNTVLVQSAEHNGKQTIAVRGYFGEPENTPLADCEKVCYVINTNPEDENKLYNVMTRDIQFSGETVATSSYAVVHQIDGFLAYGGDGGIYDAEKDVFVRRVKVAKNEDK